MTVSGSVLSETGSRPHELDSARLRRRLVPLPITRASIVIAFVYLAAHVPFLPPALEDIDSVNFALGLHDFDPARHQPHPPGYPVYIALGKMSRAVVQTVSPALDAQAVDARALGSWSAVAGAAALLLVPPLFLFTARLSRCRDAEASIVPSLLMLAASPLFWMSGLRPLSDMPGLAVTLGTQVVLLWACVRAPSGRSGRWYVPLAIAAATAGFALGVRTQILWLTAGLLAAAVVRHRRAGLVRAASVACLSFGLGALVWAVPLVIASGGVEMYLTALRTMAAEDFSDVQMLSTHPSLRALAFALLDTFAKPWGDPRLAALLIAAAGLGTGLLVWRAPPLLAWLALLFGPYLLFHLLFQETSHVRYALPILVPMAWVAGLLLTRIASALAWASATAIAAASLLLVAPVVRAYATAPMPATAAVTSAIDAQAREGGVIGSHFEFARALGVSGVAPRVLLPSPRFGERLEVLRYWRDGGRGPVWFVAAPARTGLELIDPAARRVLFRSEWRFPREWFLGGIRPAHSALVRIESPPGWVAGEGWHMTREELIRSERRGQPDATMLIARRPGPVVAFLGGEYFPGPDGGDAMLRIALDGRDLATVALAGGQPRFFRALTLPPGALDGAGDFADLDVTWRAGTGATPRVHLTHFDLQAPDRTFWVYSHGWHDREFEAATGRVWRWTSDRAELRIHGAGRDVEIRLTGDAPVAALGGLPTVTIHAGGQMLQTVHPDGAFTINVRVPAAALEAADGLLTVATNRTFVPGEGIAGGDPRRLGLRVFEVQVNPVEH